MHNQTTTKSDQQVHVGVACQVEAFPGQLEAGPPGRDEPWLWYVRRRTRGALRKVGELLRHLGRRAGKPAPVPVVFPAPVLCVGDRVRVRSAEEIRESLDEKDGVKGCSFGAGMFQYCGKEFRVVKVVNQFFDEARFRMLRARNMVLLDGVHCDGSSLADTRGCDRMCFYFWRTEWLEKIDEPGETPGP
jgi:hypothetical protein